SLKRELENAKSDSLEIVILNSLSKEYLKTTLDSSLFFSEQSLSNRKINEFPKLKFEALNLKGNYYQRIGEFDKSREQYELLVPLAEELDDAKAWSTYYNNVGIIYTNFAHYDSALEFYQKALNYEIQLKDSTGIAEAYNNIGVIHFYSSNVEKCLEYITKSIEVQEQSNGDYAVLLKGYNNLGAIYQHYQQDYDSAFKYYDKARQLCESLSELRDLSITLNNLSSLFQLQGDLDRAIEYAKKSFDIRIQQDNKEGMVSSLINMSGIEQQRKDFKKAQEYLMDGLQLSKSIGSKQLILESSRHLSENYEQMGDFKSALEFSRDQLAYTDSLFNENKDKAISELETKYETEKKEQQLALQDVEIKRQESVNQQNTILLASSGGLILLLIGLGIQGRSRLKWKNRQLLEEEKRRAREAEMNAIISSQEKERNRFARDLHDGFGQLISTLNLNLKSISTGKSKEEREKVFKTSSEVIDEMHRELRNICFDLMPQTLIKQGLSSALSEFASRINATGAKRVEVNIFGLDERLSELQEISLYRISQEWVNNNLKYSDAEKITIQITKDEEEITLLIEDDGAGFDPEILKQGKGNGWRNMTSRANLLNAEIEVDSSPGSRGSALILNIGLDNQVTASTEEAETSALQDS
ncbi:MAG: sensor histidine kinase, partial [Cyclobacteriaceae bacterium]